MHSIARYYSTSVKVFREERAMELEHDLPNFKRLLPKYKSRMSPVTLWRYRRGVLPVFGQFLINNPELIVALALDVSALHAQRLAAALASSELDTKKPR